MSFELHVAWQGLIKNYFAHTAVGLLIKEALRPEKKQPDAGGDETVLYIAFFKCYYFSTQVFSELRVAWSRLLSSGEVYILFYFIYFEVLLTFTPQYI